MQVKATEPSVAVVKGDFLKNNIFVHNGAVLLVGKRMLVQINSAFTFVFVL